MELLCVRNLGPDFLNGMGRLDDFGDFNPTQLVGRRMVHLLCIRMLWLLTLSVHSQVPFWSVTRPASLPDPRYSVLSAHCSLRAPALWLHHPWLIPVAGRPLQAQALLYLGAAVHYGPEASPRVGVSYAPASPRHR